MHGKVSVVALFVLSAVDSRRYLDSEREHVHGGALYVTASRVTLPTPTGASSRVAMTSRDVGRHPQLSFCPFLAFGLLSDESSRIISITSSWLRGHIGTLYMSMKQFLPR